MPNPNSSFQGATLSIPGVYYDVNVNGTLSTNPPTTPPLIFIGYGSGIPPLTPTNFTTPQSLINALRGGSAASFVNFLTNPSPGLAGADNITFINVGENTQGTYTLQSAAPSGVITLTTTNYGAPSNLMQVEVQSGSVGGINLTLFDGYANTGTTGYNLGIPFQLAYTGTTGTVTYSVVYTNGSASTFEITSTVAGQSMSIPIGASGYSTVTQLVQYIQGSGLPYQANVISDGYLPTADLDAASTVSLPVESGSTYTFVNVTSTLNDIAFWVNQYASTFCTATIPSTITSEPSNIPVDIPLTHFSGATSVPPLTADYANGFTLALTLPGWVVFADSNTPAVIALGASHVETASSIPERKWRRFVSGSNVGDSIATTISVAQGINSEYVSYCYPGVTAINTNTGQNQTYGGLYLGAMVAGMFCGANVNQPVTNASLNVTGLELSLTTSQINQLQQGGIIVGRYNHANLPVISSDMTCWQNDNNPSRIFNQQIAIQSAIGYGIVATLNPYIGNVNGGPVSTQIMNTALLNYLNSIIYTGVGSAGLITGYQNINLTFVNSTQSVSVSMEVVPVGQNRFIEVYTSVLPL